MIETKSGFHDPNDVHAFNNNHILIVEDEKSLAKVMSAYLENEGFNVTVAHDGHKGLQFFRENAPELLILDLMLPGLSGEEIARAVRKESDIPIIMLTAKGKEEEKITGLGIGADDYLVKPVSPREVTARVKTIFRRIQKTPGRVQQDIIQLGDLLINTLSHQVYLKEKQLFLTPTEYNILVTLATHPGRIFSREFLAERIFGFLWEGDPRTVDAHIKNLRHKIEPEPKKPIFILTVFGTGYKFAKIEP